MSDGSEKRPLTKMQGRSHRLIHIMFSVKLVYSVSMCYVFKIEYTMYTSMLNGYCIIYIWTTSVFHLLYYIYEPHWSSIFWFIYTNHIGFPPSGLYIWTTSVFHLLVYIYEPHRTSTFCIIYMNHIGLPPSVLYIWTT